MRYRKPDELKASDIEWIDNIPNDWEEAKFKYITKLEYGDSLASDDRVEGEIKVFGSNGSVGRHNKANTGAPTIIVGRKGSYGKLNYSEEPVFAIDTTYYVDSVGNKDIKWLYYLMTSMDLDAISKDTGVPGISRDDIYKRFVPLPKLDEQRSIAGFLDRKTEAIDELIQKKEQLIERLKEKRQALITHAVTKGLDPDVPMKNSGIEWLGEIPEHWEIMAFRRICDLNQGLQIAQNKRFEKGGANRYEYITIKSLNSEIHDQQYQKEYIENPPQKVIFDNDDILLARTGATGEVVTNKSGVFHNNFFKVSYDQESILKDFLVYYLQNIRLKEHLLLLAGTTTIPDLNHDEFLDSSLVLPPKSEQLGVVQYLNEKTAVIDEITNTISDTIIKLKKYRQSLISAAVTGKIDVRGEVEELQSKKMMA